MTWLEERNYKIIHAALHNPSKQYVEIQPTENSSFIQLPINVFSDTKCRHVMLHGETIVEQNKNKNSRYGQMARQGEKITWIIRPSPKKWEMIQGNEIKTP